MGRFAVLVYGILSYLLFLLTFLYMIGFLGNVLVPKTIDSGFRSELLPSILIDVGWLGLFALQHTVMARPGFKERWIRIIPAAAERSAFVLVTNLLLILLMWQWRPLPELVWSVDGIPARTLWVAFLAGWGMVLISTFLTDPFDLFGLRQVRCAI